VGRHLPGPFSVYLTTFELYGHSVFTHHMAATFAINTATAPTLCRSRTTTPLHLVPALVAVHLLAPRYLLPRLPALHYTTACRWGLQADIARTPRYQPGATYCNRWLRVLYLRDE